MLSSSAKARYNFLGLRFLFFPPTLFSSLISKSLVVLECLEVDGEGSDPLPIIGIDEVFSSVTA